MPCLCDLKKISETLYLKAVQLGNPRNKRSVLQSCDGYLHARRDGLTFFQGEPILFLHGELQEGEFFFYSSSTSPLNLPFHFLQQPYKAKTYSCHHFVYLLIVQKTWVQFLALPLTSFVSWAKHFLSQSLSFLISQMKKIIIIISKGGYKDAMRYVKRPDSIILFSIHTLGDSINFREKK